MKITVVIWKEKKKKAIPFKLLPLSNSPFFPLLNLGRLSEIALTSGMQQNKCVILILSFKKIYIYFSWSSATTVTILGQFNGR